MDAAGDDSGNLGLMSVADKTIWLAVRRHLYYQMQIVPIL